MASFNPNHFLGPITTHKGGQGSNLWVWEDRLQSVTVFRCETHVGSGLRSSVTGFHPRESVRGEFCLRGTILCFAGWGAWLTPSASHEGALTLGHATLGAGQTYPEPGPSSRAPLFTHVTGACSVGTACGGMSPSWFLRTNLGVAFLDSVLLRGHCVSSVGGLASLGESLAYYLFK